MINLEDILTLIKAVSDSELTEVKIEIEDEKEDLTFTASKNKKGDEAGISAQAVPAGMPFPFTAMTSQPVFQQPAAAPQTPGMPLIPPIPGVPPAPNLSQAAPFGAQDAAREDGEYVTSPMVGTFYAAPSEDAEPFVTVGDIVKKGQVIGIVEAMKLMNEIESPYDGVVEKILVENKAMVGFGDELMRIRTGQNGL